MTSENQIAQELLNSYVSVSTITETGRWCINAEKCIGNLGNVASKAKEEVVALTRLASDQRLGSKEKSFLGRFFKSDNEKQTLSNIESMRSLTTTSQRLAERLQEMVDVTPRSKEEQSVLVKELKLTKKDLQLQKKEVTAEMRGIRTDARQKSAGAATSLTSLLAGQKYTAIERRNIRSSKERALAPHEDVSPPSTARFLQPRKKYCVLKLSAESMHTGRPNPPINRNCNSPLRGLPQSGYWQR